MVLMYLLTITFICCHLNGLNAAKRYYENQFCQPRATVVQTHPRKYPFFVSLHRCAGSSWSLDPPSTVKCVPEVEEYVNLSVYDKQQRIRVSITVTNHTKCKPECVAKKSDCSYPNVFENCQCKCPYLLKPNNIHCNPGKSWHSTKCKCSCNKVVNCPSRRRFDEESCSCKCKQERKIKCEKDGGIFKNETCGCRRINTGKASGNKRIMDVALPFWICTVIAEFIIMVIIFEVILYYKNHKGLFYKLFHLCRPAGHHNVSKSCKKSSAKHDEIGRLNSSRENIIDESSDSYVYT